MHKSLKSVQKSACSQGIKMTKERREITWRIWNHCFTMYDFAFTHWNEIFGEAFDFAPRL
jgi:hypothetical protein